jgi:small subunit ribosomal protein S13e
MVRMHSKGKGIASSAMPYKRTAPQWQKSSAAEVEEQCCKLAKKGMRPSAIGVTLRDSMGIPMVPSRCCFK